MNTSTPVQSVTVLGRAIRSQRKLAGLTLAEAAGLTNVGIRFLSELENGKPTIRFDKLLHVLQAFGMQLQLTPSVQPNHLDHDQMPTEDST